MIHLEIPVYTLICNTIIVFALCLFVTVIPYITVAESSSIVDVALTAVDNCEDVTSIPIEVVPEVVPEVVVKATPVPIAKAAPAKPRPIPRPIPRPAPRKKVVEEKVAKPSSTSIAKTADLRLYSHYEGVIWFLKSHERFSPVGFFDHKQVTIGFGTKTKKVGDTITWSDASKVFIDEINKRHAALLKKYPNLKEDRLVSLVLTNLVFNIGTPKGGLSKAIADYRPDDIKTKKHLCFYIKKYVHASGKVLEGLVKRRNEECELIMASDAERQVLYQKYKLIVSKESAKYH